MLLGVRVRHYVRLNVRARVAQTQRVLLVLGAAVRSGTGAALETRTRALHKAHVAGALGRRAHCVQQSARALRTRERQRRVLRVRTRSARRRRRLHARLQVEPRERQRRRGRTRASGRRGGARGLRYVHVGADGVRTSGQVQPEQRTRALTRGAVSARWGGRGGAKRLWAPDSDAGDGAFGERGHRQRGGRRVRTRQARGRRSGWDERRIGHRAAR